MEKPQESFSPLNKKELEESMMPLPPFAVVPPASVRSGIPALEWETYLDLWIFLAEKYLQSPQSDFRDVSDNGRSQSYSFLQSFLAVKDPPSSPRWPTLRRVCFLLIHRILSDVRPAKVFLSWEFISAFSAAYRRNHALTLLLQLVWKKHGKELEGSLGTFRDRLTQDLESSNAEEAAHELTAIIPFLVASEEAATVLMVGSDLLDGLVAAYRNEHSSLQELITIATSTCLIALLESPKPNLSLFSVHAYSLKSSADIDRTENRASLLSDIVTNTTLLAKTEAFSQKADAGRAKSLARSLEPFCDAAVVRTKPQRIKTGKVRNGLKVDSHSQNSFPSEIHVHRMSLVSQIQELFPDLGAGFVMKLLDEYNEDPERATAALLEDSLPEHFRGLDRSEQLPPIDSEVHDAVLTEKLVPRSTPPRAHSPRLRRNIYDDDAFDRLAIDAGNLHIGRKNANKTADAILADVRPDESQRHKAAIMSALAAFDADDDERDDTYDIEDVGGTIDTTVGTDTDAAADQNEEALFQAWLLSGPEVFARDATTRRGKARSALKSETGMTDEAIEGWGLMLGRDPRRRRRLEAKYATFTGQQYQIERTAWTATRDGDTDEENTAATESGRGRGRGRGRGFPGFQRGGRGGRGGGAVAGPSSEQGTQQARQRKEASKGSRANHNRRDQRARKVARAGFPG